MPTDQQQHRVPERGYGMGYQESVRIESRCEFGMEADEFYRRQVGLVLDEIPKSLSGDDSKLLPRQLNGYDKDRFKKEARKAGMKLVKKCDLNLTAGKKVLDLAVGEGDTSRYFATTGASVEARDIEGDLINAAKERDQELRKSPEIQNITDDTRKKTSVILGNVNYKLGDYGSVKSSLDDKKDNQFDAVTVMGTAFIYLGERANYEKALKDFYDLLVPGGKVVIQSRQRIRQKTFPWAQKLGVKSDFREVKDQKGNDRTEYVRTDKDGTEFVWTYPIAPKDDPGKFDGFQVTKYGDKKTLSDGITQVAASRYIRYEDGRPDKLLGNVIYDNHLILENLGMWTQMLKKAGFGNIGLKMEGLTEDRTEAMYAIVAEKPKRNAVSKLMGRLAGRAGNVFKG